MPGARPGADEMTLVVVTKFFPPSDIRVLADLGVRHVGKTHHRRPRPRPPSARADLELEPGQLVGGLQSNKAAAGVRD